MAQVSLNTRISPDLFAELENFCSENKRSKASVVEEALKRFFAERSNLGGERSNLGGERS